MPTELDTGMEAYRELQERDDEIPEDPNQHDAHPISTQSLDWSISVLREHVEEGLIDLQPHFQRQYVWELKPALPPRLIESLLLEIPIPPIYLGTLPGGRMEIIDGQQRLTTLLRFVNNEFPLRYLEKLPSLNGKFFRDLSREHQGKIRFSPIRTVKVDAGYNAELRYELFERLNRGSMPLNEAELRNCVFHGPLSDLLAELEGDSVWRKVKGTDQPEPRYVEREMILRFLSFSTRVDFYTGSLKRFLNNYMKANANMVEEQISDLRVIFQQTIRNVYAVFGAHSGRLYSAGTEDRPTHDGKWETKFSVSAFDIQASALIGLRPIAVQMAAEQIREAYLLYLLTSPQVRLAINRQPAGTVATKTRWYGFKDKVRQLLDDIKIEPRFFSYELRKKLYNESPVCLLCHNEIHSLEDATVDHIHPYSKGGKTVPENAQLAHRSCNAKKCARVEPVAAGPHIPEPIQSRTDVPTNIQVPDTHAKTIGKQDPQSITELDHLTPHTLNEDFSYKRPYGFVLAEQSYTNVTTWSHLYKLICSQLAATDAARFARLPSNPAFTSSRGLKEFTTDPSALRTASEITEGIYAEINHSANALITLIKDLLTEFGIPLSSIAIYLEEGHEKESPASSVANNQLPETIQSGAGVSTNIQVPHTHADVGKKQDQQSVTEVKHLDTHTLDESFTYKRPSSFILLGHRYTEVTTWRYLYELVCLHLLQRDPDRFEALCDSPRFMSKQGKAEITKHPKGLRFAIALGRGIYAEGNYAADEIRNHIRHLLTEFGLKTSDLTIQLGGELSANRTVSARGGTRRRKHVAPTGPAQPASTTDHESRFAIQESSPQPTLCKPGDRVRHHVFGEGQVLEAVAQGDDQKVTVLFKTGVKKLLMAKAARLERL